MVTVSQITPITISDLPAASTLSGNEPLPIVQGGNTVQTTVNALPQGMTAGVVVYGNTGGAPFPNFRTLTAGSGVTIVDSGAQGSLTISLAGGAGINSVSIASANGFAGISSGGSSPILTLSTSVNGIAKGNGTSLSAATAGVDYEVPLTFSTGLTRSTNTITVNTAQNIATLSNLSSNGFVKTSGGNGTLSVDTTAYADASFKTIAVSGQSDVVADSAADTLTLVAGTNITITTNAGSDSITINADGGGSVEVIAQSSTIVSHTGDTSETTVADYTLPANTLPSNGMLRITALWSRNSGGAGTVTTRIRFSTISGTVFFTNGLSTSTLSSKVSPCIWAANSTGSQKELGATASGLGNSSSAIVVSSVDTTVDTHIVFTIECADSGDTGSLQGYVIELLTL